MSGIYIHVPFCKKACHYCDFHFSTQTDYLDVMMDSILKELQIRKDEWHGKTIKTIYFGGGTPSLMEIEHLEAILDEIRNHANVHAKAEITLEANPDDLIDDFKVYDFKEAGINRLSVGVQSNDDDVLEWMNRSHDGPEGLYSLQVARDAGFLNISADLIYGHPHLNEEKLIEFLDDLMFFDILHLSAYALTIEPRTVFANHKERGILKELPEEEVNHQFDVLNNYLKEKGFQHYEVSNWAKLGFISEHNSAYWKSVDYIGIGPSAHSFNGTKRRWNVRNNQVYLKKIKDQQNDFYDSEVLTPQNRYNEYLMTRLRTVWGVEKQQLSTFGSKAQEEFQKQRKLSDFSKYLREDDDRYFIEEKDWVWADRVASELFWV